jgi:hypothetical protein
MLDRYIQNPCEEFSQQQSNRAREAYINRKNASNSTASTCEAETDRSAKNLRRHEYGDCAGATVVMDEEADKLAYDAHLTAYFQTFQPVSQPEYDAVRRAADAQWRYDRLISIETGLLNPARLESPTIASNMLATQGSNHHQHHCLALAFREAHLHSGTNPLDLCHHYLGTALRDIERFIRKFYSLRRKKTDRTNPA